LRDAAVTTGEPLFVRPQGGRPSGENRLVSTPPPIGTERVDPRPAPMRAGPRGTPVYVAAIVLLAAGVGGVVAYGKWGKQAPPAQPIVQPTPPAPQPQPQPQPTPPPPKVETKQYGKISLKLTPADANATITINNTIVTVPELEKVESGFKLVKIQAPGYEPDEKSFTLQPDMNYPLEVTLKKLHGGHPTKKSPTKNVGDTPVPPPPQPLDRNGTVKPDFGK